VFKGTTLEPKPLAEKLATALGDLIKHARKHEEYLTELWRLTDTIGNANINGILTPNDIKIWNKLISYAQRSSIVLHGEVLSSCMLSKRLIEIARNAHFLLTLLGGTPS
jgi:hypothetical protein